MSCQTGTPPEQFQQVMGEADEAPLGFVFLEAAEGEAAESADFLDLAKDWFKA